LNKISPLKAIRLRKGISQDQLAALTSYTQGYISFVEKGRRVPSYENLVVFAEALNCSVEDLSEGNPRDKILNEFKEELKGLSSVELEKALDYVQVLKRGRR
jgi:transcriptional regulator with XRE-family HTH domain